MLVVAYIASGALEILGIAITVRDLLRQRVVAADLAQPPPSEPVVLEKGNVRRFPGSLTMRRLLLQQEHDREQSDEHLRSVLNDVLPGRAFSARSSGRG